VIIKPKFKGFICTTAHPEGCAASVKEQINYVKKQSTVEGPKHVLVIGASTGYGLASRIVSTFNCGAATIGVFFEKPPIGNKTATAGWYNSAAFEENAITDGYYAKSINGDAFSTDIKNRVIDLIKKDWGTVDLVVYSLASPRRTHPISGETLVSSIKPIGEPFTSKNIDFHKEIVSDITVAPATEDEVRQAVGVMGGEDWEMWVQALQDGKVLAKEATVISYSYIGPEVTHPIYRDGTIGKAKESLESSAQKINALLHKNGGRAFISVNKAVVTQASTAIPGMSLYMSLLFRVMKEKGLHEHCIEQIYRLFHTQLYGTRPTLDAKDRIRLDDWEMKPEVQQKVKELWEQTSTENLTSISAVDEYRNDFFRLFGFGFAGVDYEKDVPSLKKIPSIHE